MIAALVAGTILAVGALAFVLHPLFFGVRAAKQRAPSAPEPHLAVAALREIEFDRATGKLSDVDYHDLRARYIPAALAEIRQGEAPAHAATDPVEIAVLAYRAEHRDCPSCGSRPEADAAYCSDCGRYLDGKCGGCGAPVEVAGARFCPGCGQRLAA